MITGDHVDTARAIAERVGLLRPGDGILTGAELDGLDAAGLAARLPTTAVFARVSPEHKVRIVEAFRASGEVVAMTGDGVNDAPALKRADIGVAMGLTGTDVSRETADMVLTDDNFATIVHAVEEGRVIYGNIRKFVFYLLSCNIGEILIILLAMLLALAPAPPLTPIMLLWLNLVTDGLPALALGLEPGAPDVMRRPPREAGEPVLARSLWPLIGVQAAVDAAVTLAAFTWAYGNTADLAYAQTLAYATLACAELLRAFTSRSQTRSLVSLGLGGNPWLLRAVLASFGLLLATLYLPFLSTAFGTVPLDGASWALVLSFALLPALAAELTKAWLRRRAPPLRQGAPA
jgi:Ca2+-transporting ATPase